jgi:NAD(P)H-nitrite reductase large subunit
MKQTKYLIIGGGIAGTTAAETIRHHDSDGEICLLTEEKERLYSRVQLPHYLRGTVEYDRVFLKKPTFYEENGIEFFSETRVVKVDTDTKIVETESGDQFGYEKLLLATGGKLIPWEKDQNQTGIVYLRTIEHAKKLKEMMTGFQEAVVVGGGFIALEFVTTFIKNNLKTTMLVREPYFFQKFLDEEGGQLVETILQNHGVTVITEAEVNQIVGDGQVSGVTLNSGKQIPCQLIGVGIGIRPTLRFLDTTPIVHDPFIETDENFAVSGVTDVWAAGDVTFFPSRLIEGRRINFQNWANAAEQGRLAGASMTQTESELIPLSTTYSINFFDSSISAVGITNPNFADQVIARGSKKEGKLGRLFKKNNRLIGALLVGLPADRVSIMKLLASDIGTDYDEKMKSLEFSLGEVQPRG